MAYLMPIYQEQLQIAQRRTLRQMSSQRVKTIFSEPNRPYGGYFSGNQYGGQ
jgi:ribosomal protein L34E